jgi:hypothetical protein
MKDMILVDNAIYSFGLQLSNGIPIIPFKHDKSDNEFLFLKKFLLDCHNLDDLREPLKASFNFQELYENYNFSDFIAYYEQEVCEEEQEKDDLFDHEQWLLRKD